jgi:hypothetical protein
MLSEKILDCIILTLADAEDADQAPAWFAGALAAGLAMALPPLLTRTLAPLTKTISQVCRACAFGCYLCDLANPASGS